MIDNKSFNTKPRGGEVGAIQQRLMSTTKRSVESIKELSEALKKRITVRPGVLAFGSKKAKDFEVASTIFIDIDSYDKDSIKNTKELLKSKGLEAAIIYKSFSYEEVDNKKTKNGKQNIHYKTLKYNHRIVFKLKEDITDADYYCEAMTALIQLLSGDESCKDAGRLMYGAKEIVEVNEEATLSTNKINMIIKKWKKSIPKNACKGSNINGVTCIENNKGHIYHDIRVNMSEYLNKCKNEAITNIDNDFEEEFFHLNYELDIEEFIKLCYKIPLDKIFSVEIDKVFHCIFHDDKNPSATIKFHNNKYTYKCFANCIEGSLDIFHLISLAITGEKNNFNKAIKWLIKKLDIKLKCSSWKIVQGKMLSDNANFINHLEELKELGYHDLYKALNTVKIKNIYRILLTYGQEVLNKTMKIEEDEDLIIQISRSRICKELGINYDTGIINDLMGYLASIKIIDKISDTELREKYPNQWKRACKLREKKQGNKTIDAYRMNRMTEEHISICNALEIYRKAMGMTKSSNRVTDIFLDVATKTKGRKLTEEELNQYKQLDNYYSERLRKYGYVELKGYNTFAKKKGIKESKARKYLPLLNKNHSCLKIKKSILQKLKLKDKSVKVNKRINANSTLFTNLKFNDY